MISPSLWSESFSSNPGQDHLASFFSLLAAATRCGDGNGTTILAIPNDCANRPTGAVAESARETAEPAKDPAAMRLLIAAGRELWRGTMWQSRVQAHSQYCRQPHLRAKWPDREARDYMPKPPRPTPDFKRSRRLNIALFPLTSAGEPLVQSRAAATNRSLKTRAAARARHSRHSIIRGDGSLAQWHHGCACIRE